RIRNGERAAGVTAVGGRAVAVFDAVVGSDDAWVGAVGFADVVGVERVVGRPDLDRLADPDLHDRLVVQDHLDAGRRRDVRFDGRRSPGAFGLASGRRDAVRIALLVGIVFLLRLDDFVGRRA